MPKVHPITPVAVVLSLMSAPSALQAFSPPEQGELYVAAQARNLGSRNRKALHAVATAGDVAWVKRLIDENPRRISEKDLSGQTPLHLAAKTGSEEVCKIFLKAGTDHWLRDKDNITAVGVAIQENHTDVGKIFSRDKSAQLVRYSVERSHGICENSI